MKTNRKDLRKLAEGLMGETLHGPVPLESTMLLAAGVIELLDEIEEPETTSESPDTSIDVSTLAEGWDPDDPGYCCSEEMDNPDGEYVIDGMPPYKGG